jgi:hypothetical protein
MNTKAVIKSQYLAALKMLRQAVNECPPEVWDDQAYKNRFWRVAYHTLFHTDLYLSLSEKEFRPWDKHIEESPLLGPMHWAGNREPKTCDPYSKEDILEYYEECVKAVEPKLDAVELDAASGFHWLPFMKLELQIYNIRHIQHHAAQLIERLRQAAGIQVGWVGLGEKETG